MIARPSVGESGSTDEVHLAADAGVEPMSDRVGDDLPRQVDLDRRVDRDHPAERADHVGVVREVDRPHLDHRVVMDEVVEALRAHDEGGHDLAAVALLARPGDDAGLDQIDHRVREHLGVDPEIAFVAEREGRCRRDRADAELERGAVGDEIGDELADLPLDCADLPDGVLVRRHVDLDREIDVAHVDEAVAERPRHRRD